MTSAFDSRWLLWAFVVVGAVAAYFLAGDMKGISLERVDPGTIGTVFLGFMFVALLIERAVEVYMGSVTNTDKDALVNQRNALRAALDEELAKQTELNGKVLDDAQAIAARDASVAALETSMLRRRKLLEAVERKIAALDQATQRLALSISVPISIVVALAGVRVFGSILPAQSLLPNQTSFFTSVDVILTAGLLAGGADGVHKILDRFLKLAAGKQT